MTQTFSPFTATVHQLGEQFLAGQAELTRAQVAQMDLVDAHLAAQQKLARAAFTAGTTFTSDVTRTLVAAFAPPAATPAA